MKTTSRRIVEFGMWSFCASWLLLNASPAYAATGKMLLAGTNQKLFLVDVVSGQASALSLTIGAGDSATLSPNAQYLTVAGPKGMTVYEMTTGVPQWVARITDSAVSRAVWSEDSAVLVYLLESKIAEGGVAIQIYMWDAATKQAKMLL